MTNCYKIKNTQAHNIAHFKQSLVVEVELVKAETTVIVISCLVKRILLNEYYIWINIAKLVCSIHLEKKYIDNKHTRLQHSQYQSSFERKTKLVKNIV